MKSSIVTLALVAVCAAVVQGRQPRAGIRDVAWIAGAWTSGTSAVVEERWTPPAGGAMLGMSRTIRGDRMSEFEFLRIVEREGGLVYIAQPGGRSPTEFRMTAIDATSVTFENPAHDFPKMIRYAKHADGSLEASISGEPGTKAMSWRFTPIAAR